MQISIQSKINTGQCLVLFVNNSKKLVGKTALAVDAKCNGTISQVINDRQLNINTAGSHCFIHRCQGSSYSSILLIALGKKMENIQQQWQLVQKIGSRVVACQLKQVALDLDALYAEVVDSSNLAQQLAQALMQKHYSFEHYKSNPKARVAQQLQFISNQSNLASQISVGSAIGKAINSCKDLGNQPPNICTPQYLAEFAQQLSQNNNNCQCQIIEQQQMETEGMHSLLSVSKGSVLPPKLIVLNYKGAANNSQPIALVGKGVTFDSGGISLKPGAKMDEMKFDMCGAATVLGVAQAVLEMQLSINMVVVVPAVENMPSGIASKPGDIVRSMSGKTIEILNTDAEGRLILCDALTYVQKYFNPQKVIDVATLTGACIVALGHHLSAVYSNNEQLAQQLLDAGLHSGDEAWRMPLGKKYTDQLKSPFADLANIGGMAAGSVTAASFLQEFCRDCHWAHLDIAGVAWQSGANKGATGRPVSLLIEYLSRQ